MTPTGRVNYKPVATPTPRLAEAKSSGPPAEYFSLTHDTNTRFQTAFINLKNDFKLKECPRVWGIKSPLCQDSYVFEPKDELTCDRVIKRYGLNKNEIMQRGLLKGLCSDSTMKSNAAIEIPKDYFEEIMAKSKAAAEEQK